MKLLLAALLIFAAQSVCADYPERPVRIVVGMPASSTFPIILRALTAAVPDSQMQFYLDHKVGQGNLLAYQNAARSKPDGYTLAFVSTSVVINPLLHDDAGYSASADFEPVLFLGAVDSGLLAHPSVPFKTVAQLSRYAQKNPGKVSFGHYGNATQGYLGILLMADRARSQFMSVPYSGRGGDAVVTDLFSGTIDLHLIVMGRVQGHVSTGRVRLLATTGLARSASFPQVPTVAETYPGYESIVWYALAAPRGTPQAVRRKLEAELSAGLSAPSTQRALIAIGIEPLAKSPTQAAQFISSEEKKWGALLSKGRQ